MVKISKRIKNKHYKLFLETGFIEPIQEDLIIKMLNNVPAKRRTQARALVISLYLTGARPSEVLKQLSRNIKKTRSYYIIEIIDTTKNALPRKVYVNNRNKLAAELYEYAQNFLPDMFLFPDYISNYMRTHEKKNGEIVTYVETTRKVRHLLYKISETVLDEGIPPYFLRHNRFSKLAENGASLEDIRQIKGARSMDSVTPYLHMSSKIGKKISRWLD